MSRGPGRWQRGESAGAAAVAANVATACRELARALDAAHEPPTLPPLGEWRTVVSDLSEGVPALAGVCDRLADLLDVQLQHGHLHPPDSTGPLDDVFAVVSSATAALEQARDRLVEAAEVLQKVEESTRLLVET